MKPSLTLASLILLLAPLTARAEEWRWGEIVREELFSPYFAETPDADAVVLLDHGIARVDDKMRLKFQHHVRTKIMTDKGLDRAVVRIPYPAEDEIKNFRAHTIVPPGNELKVEKQHIREETDPAGKVMVVTFPGVQKGVVLEWEYELRSDRIDVLPEWRFQGRDPVRVSLFELQAPPGLSYDACFPWAPGQMPVVVKTMINDPENPKRQLEQSAWEQRLQAPVAGMPFVPYPAEYAVTLHVQLHEYKAPNALEESRRFQTQENKQFQEHAFMRSWTTVGKDLATALDATLADAAGVREWAAQDAAVAAAADPAAKAHALFARVRDGLGTDAPRERAVAASPRAVVAAGHGTPTEKNLVLLALLRAESIAAEPVYVRTRTSGRFEERRTDPAQLDRVVLCVPEAGGSAWLDAAPHCPWGVLAPDVRVTQGVKVVAAGSGVVDVTAPAPESSRSVVTTGALDRNGSFEATSQLTLTGDRALAVRTAVARDGDTAWAEKLVHARFGDSASVESSKVTGLAEPAAPLVVEVKYRVPAFANVTGERVRCAEPFLERVTANPLPETERAIPAELPFRGVSREEVTLALPAGWSMEVVPAEARVRSADVTAKITYAKAAGTVTATREVTVTEPVVNERDLDRLKTFFDGLCAADRGEFALRASTVRSAATP